MTNFEKIAQSEETLGKFIGMIIWCADCPGYEECKTMAHGSDECETRCIPKMIEWLKQEADEK